jgi:long-chain acyl-CoA synthetase
MLEGMRGLEVNKCNRVTHTTVPPEKVPFLKGMRTEFESFAQVMTVRAEEIPDKVYILYNDQKITYQQTNQRANRIANYLRTLGVKKGDVVSLLIINSPEILYVLFGIMKIGAIAGSINFLLKGPELAYVLDDCKPKVVFVGSDFMETFADGYKAAVHKPKVVEVTTDVGHDIHIAGETLNYILQNYPDDEALVPQTPSDPCLLLYSSGTTGSPKGILLSNANHIFIARTFSGMGFINADDVHLMIMPMFHVSPLTHFVNSITYCGQTLCIRRAFSRREFWPTVIRYGVTIVTCVPAMWNFLYYSSDTDDIDLSKHKLRKGMSGGAPLPAELINGIKEKFDVDIIEAYGLTEACAISTCNPIAGKKKPGSIGVAIPGLEVEIMDEANQQLPVGQVGEICIKGGSVMMGYLNNPDAIKETVVDGWLHTGDVGYMDDEGFFFIVDRKKDMIIRGGENIYPREIEIVLEAHPKIQVVSVIGVQDHALGEKVKAYIIVKENETMTEADLRSYLNARIAKYKIPEFIEFVKDLPRNATGKVMKRELRAMEQQKAMTS